MMSKIFTIILLSIILTGCNFNINNRVINKKQFIEVITMAYDYGYLNGIRNSNIDKGREELIEVANKVFEDK
jgi:hypothetical protein